MLRDSDLREDGLDHTNHFRGLARVERIGVGRRESAGVVVEVLSGSDENDDLLAEFSGGRE